MTHAGERNANDSVAHDVATGGLTMHRGGGEGVRAGLLAVAAGAVWSAIVDLAAGHPFETWTFLGSSLVGLFHPWRSPSTAAASLVFLAFITLIFVGLGRLGVRLAHRSDVQPSLLLLGSTALTLITLALVAFSAAFTTSRLGNEAWLQILGSSLIALWTLGARLYYTHPSLAGDAKRAGNE